MADFKELIKLPAWLRRPDSVAQGAHELTLFARAVGAVFNGLTTKVYAIRKMWIASLATGVILVEHGKDRAVLPGEFEPEEDYRARVLLGLRAKTPGESMKGMKIALDTLGLADYEIVPLWKVDFDQFNLAPGGLTGARWAEFDVVFPAASNNLLTDEEIQRRIDRAKAPSKKGNVSRIPGVTGFGLHFGSDFGGVQADPDSPDSGFGASGFGTGFGS